MRGSLTLLGREREKEREFDLHYGGRGRRRGSLTQLGSEKEKEREFDSVRE